MGKFAAPWTTGKHATNGGYNATVPKLRKAKTSAPLTRSCSHRKPWSPLRFAGVSAHIGCSKGSAVTSFLVGHGSTTIRPCTKNRPKKEIFRGTKTMATHTLNQKHTSHVGLPSPTPRQRTVAQLFYQEFTDLALAHMSGTR